MRKLLTTALITVVATLGSASVAAANSPNDLSPFVRQFDSAPFTGPTDQQYADLAQKQFDPNAVANNNVGVPAGFTYLGQFFDHDLTLDTTPAPATDIDPTTLNNNRTFRFDLDSVYGGGPKVSPQLYDGDKFKTQEPNQNGVRDLPRNPNGSAILVEGRNDENQVIAQFHLAVLKFHNHLIDDGHSFAEAQQLTQWHYQWLVVHDYLPHIVGQDRVDAAFSPTNNSYKPKNPNQPVTPVEFSAAIFRYGHSQVRRAYGLQPGASLTQVFSFTQPDLRGGRPLGSNRQIAWQMFFDVDGVPTPTDQNISRKLDTLISSSLFQLPIPGAEATGSNVLGFRNLIRADRYGLPSGEDVARELGVEPLTKEELGDLGPGFENGTPLWYYVLKEAEVRENGQRLGDVGGKEVAEIFTTLLKVDRNSYLNNGFTPSVPHEGEFTVGDFLKYAGVAG